MRPLFDYDNYRRFLGDWFQEMKARRRTFSYRAFARKAGFTSCGFPHQVVEGQRNLTTEAVDKMILGLGLSDRKAEYFRALVRFEQARRQDEKKQAWAEMNRLRKDSSFFRLNRSHLRYFEHWWYPVLRNLAVHAPWGGDFSLLASLVDPPITEAQARRGLDVLEEVGMLEKTEDGNWQMTSVLVTSADIPAMVKSETRRETLQLGLEALDRFALHERHASYYTLGIRERDYPRLLERIEELNAHASAIASEGDRVDRVYELAVLLYPLSKPLQDLPR